MTAPIPLSAEHDLASFACGRSDLDDWLRYRAIRAEGRSARTYVTCVGTTVVGYYSFAAAAVRIDEVPKKMQRNMPPIVPMILIGRLAVDEEYQRLGIGKGLLKDALARAIDVARTIGTRGVMVHALDANAAAFYASFGFQDFPLGSLTLFLPNETIARVIGVGVR